jgi:hypothetical protein
MKPDVLSLRDASKMLRQPSNVLTVLTRLGILRAYHESGTKYRFYRVSDLRKLQKRIAGGA